LLAFVQVGRLFREVRWVNSFRAGSETTEPVLLAPMKAMIGRSSTIAFSTSSMRTMLDSIATRLDESRDTSRYLVGLLVFLGLLGTFWGLLNTIGSIRETIDSLDPGSGDAAVVLESLKQGLSAPLAGMGTAFSSSLFGLSGSLVLGFLDLQAGRAQTRFYTELENWLSSVTDLSSDIVVAEPPKAESSDEIRVLSERLRNMQENGGANPRVATAMANLADGISGLVKNMRSEQQIMRDWVEAQSDEQKAMRNTLEKIADALKKTGVH
ncbi:MAG: flagellar motor protein MotA, partial [Mesorhizobium sp.]